MKPSMTLEQAKAILATCLRNRLVDEAFGDEEVDWFRDGKCVAGGYRGNHSCSVSIDETLEFARTSFVGDHADVLCAVGLRGRHTRNDAGDSDD